ncbi:MAG: ABC transporter permease, partial [Candidatus Heimdallarchaeota archaeon]
TPVVDLETEDFSSENISYIDFFLPGIIGVIIMNTGIIGTIMRQVHLQKIGVLRKFTTTPLTRIEYVSAELIWQFMIAFIATLLSVLTAWGVFGYSWFSFNIMILPIVIVGVVLFSGLGLLLSQIVRSRNNALIVGAMITIPMFFLSGIFFDISNSKVLIILSKFSPLTFIVDALRASMITGNYSEAGINIAIALGIGIVAIVIGTIFTRWERD